MLTHVTASPTLLLALLYCSIGLQPRQMEAAVQSMCKHTCHACTACSQQDLLNKMRFVAMHVWKAHSMPASLFQNCTLTLLERFAVAGAHPTPPCTPPARVWLQSH
jgi:hypothetical protein